MIRPPSIAKKRTHVIPITTENVQGQIFTNGAVVRSVAVNSLTPVVTLVVRGGKNNLESFLRTKSNELEISFSDAQTIYRNDPTAFGEVPKARLWSIDPPRNWSDLEKMVLQGQNVEVSGADLRRSIRMDYHLIFDIGTTYTLRPVISNNPLEIYFYIQSKEADRRGRLLNEWSARTGASLSSIEVDRWSGGFEDFLGATKSTFKDVCYKHGMIVKKPYGQDTEYEYFMDHFQQTIGRRSEVDILTSLGAYVYFDEYDDLEFMAYEVTRGQDNVFVVLTDAVAKKAVNKELMTLEKIADACPSVVFGLGNVYRYFAFSVPEMLGSFTDNMNDPTFYKPYNIAEEFTARQIDDITVLLEEFKDDRQEVVDLIAKIGRINTWKRYFDDAMKKLVKVCSELPKQQKKDLATFFEELFVSAMYMRQWRGPPHPYPAHEMDTRFYSNQGSVSFYIDVSEHLNKAWNLMNKFKFLKKAPMYNIAFGSICKEGHDMEEYLRDVKNNERCIRMSSSPILTTCYHYARFLKLENVPTIDPFIFQPIL